MKSKKKGTQLKQRVLGTSRISNEFCVEFIADFRNGETRQIHYFCSYDKLNILQNEYELYGGDMELFASSLWNMRTKGVFKTHNGVLLRSVRPEHIEIVGVWRMSKPYAALGFNND